MEAHLNILLTPHEAHGKPAAQLATRRLVADAAEQACAQHMQLGLAHGALEAKQQSIVEHGRVINAVGIADERVGEAAEIEQATIPTCLSATSAVSREKPLRSTTPEPDRPRSSSMTMTCCAGQPSAVALAAKAYWRCVDSRLCWS